MSNDQNIPTSINWPDGINEAVFLSEYWQKKPLLIRQAFSEFSPPLSADELAGLSLEAETTPRLITQNDEGHYHLEHGPFDEDRFSKLGTDDWSLLVTDVEKYIPEFTAYLKPFNFLPSWRIDDLMISYAPIGASVGAHVDEYDVFLLQASGKRQWSIEEPSDNKPRKFVEDSILKLIDGFEPTDTWNLEPGDILYLPPGIGHLGVASAEPCTTWSIGFRAPAISDIVMRLSEMIAETLPATRYTDNKLRPAIQGQITDEALTDFRQIWNHAVSLDDIRFADLVANLLTESGVAENISNDEIPQSDSFNAALNSNNSMLYKAPFTQMAWHGVQGTTPSDPVTLSVNGELFYCSQSLAVALCGTYPIALPHDLSKADNTLIAQLQQSGCLLAD